MARPRATELTERELEIMQIFWQHGEQTAQDVRDRMAESGRDLAYTTVATLVRILWEKGFVETTNEERPFRYQPVRSFEDVSSSLVNNLLQRVFGGSREKLLVSLLGQERLTKTEREALRQIIEGERKGGRP